tara:strand:+ start:911 stop:1321 length:411 start_codon:yes stop_codon:yes gene_type:complete
MLQPEEKNVPKILLEFLIYGTDEDKPLVTKALDELQKQQSNSRAATKRMRILWYMDKGEKTPDEKKAWFERNRKCKYFKFIEPPYEIPKNFVKDCLQKIRLCENAVNSLKGAGIELSKATKLPPLLGETYAEIIEE